MSVLDTLKRPAVLGSLLAASVAANLFLGGILAGRIGAHAMHPPLFERGIESKFRALPPEQRREMRAQMRRAMPVMREHRAKMQELHAALATELARETPDRAVLERQFAAIREQWSAMQRTLHEGFIDSALKQSPEERKRTLDALLRARGPGHHGPDPGGFGPRPGMPGQPHGMPLPPPEAPEAGADMPGEPPPA